MLMLKIIYYFYVLQNINLFFINLCRRRHEKMMISRKNIIFQRDSRQFWLAKSQIIWLFRAKHRFHAMKSMFY